MEPQKFTNFGLQLSLGVKDWLKVYVYRCFFPLSYWLLFALPFSQKCAHEAYMTKWTVQNFHRGFQQNTLQGSPGNDHISHLGKTKILFKCDFWWDMFVSGRVGFLPKTIERWLTEFLSRFKNYLKLAAATNWDQEPSCGVNISSIWVIVHILLICPYSFW